MKKYIITACSLAMLTLSSCDLNINDDPNYPGTSDVTTDLQFPAVENFIATSANDIMFNYAGFFAQYFEQKPESNQFNDLAEQTITEASSTIDRAYRNLYAGALEDIEDIKSRSTNKADLFAATVLRAYTFQLLVDNMSDCPYTEALQGSANPMPKWDDGETVYNGVLKEMDDAEAALDASSDQMTMTDMLFNKNIDQWKGYANALRLRMYLRMYDKDSSVKDKITALVQANNFFTGDAAMDIYSNDNDNRSPFYGSYYALGTGNHVAAYPIISYMTSTSDPRISYAFNVASATGKYVGQMPGAKTIEKEWTSSKDWKNKDVSAVNYDLYNGTGATRPAYFFTQANLQFLIAEVKYRFLNDAAGAKAAYEAAVKADFSARGYSSEEAATFLANGASWDNASDKLKLIYMQKWAALFYMDNMEAWSEIRRTDVPALSSHTGEEIYKDPSIYEPGDLITPTINGLEAGGLMKRMFYPLTARNLNNNTPAAQPGSTPVWWDVK